MAFTEAQIRNIVREEAANGLLVSSLATFKMRVGEGVWDRQLTNAANNTPTKAGDLLRYIEKGQANTCAHVTATFDIEKLAQRVAALVRQP